MKFMLQTNSRDDENSYKTSAMLIMADRYCEELDNLKGQIRNVQLQQQILKARMEAQG